MATTHQTDQAKRYLNTSMNTLVHMGHQSVLWQIHEVNDSYVNWRGLWEASCGLDSSIRHLQIEVSKQHVVVEEALGRLELQSSRFMNHQETQERSLLSFQGSQQESLPLPSTHKDLGLACLQVANSATSWQTAIQKFESEVNQKVTKPASVRVLHSLLIYLSGHLRLQLITLVD
jgi:hypothetical protein